MITKYLERNHEIDKPLFYSLDDCLQDLQKRSEAMMREYYEEERLERRRRRARARDVAHGSKQRAQPAPTATHTVTATQMP